MASSNAVWGIDLGQCALKALRCTVGDDGRTIVADAFDYIEYPKILTEPDANPEQLVRDALKQFLANNSVRDCKVAISVPGQSGLARFIKLPPVEAKKIPDIVKYEAKQQIPFSLEDVIWDYQALLGGVQDEGVALETEVGLFAMKRDQVFRALRPFRDAGIELDVVQLTPIAIYNAVVHGVLDPLPSAAEYDPDEPPKSMAVISMGTDTTDLVVTNGFRIWQRSIPIGGSHFTKQLTKEMKLTFAKAEQLKRNARQAEDPKAVFQAMRPVFNDFVQDLQRSLGFFRSIDRRAKITEGVVLGNAMLLPGLQPYVEKNLDLPFRKVSEFQNLSGSVVAEPKFKDNMLSFAVSYGLCLQALGKSRLSTNLIPRELLTARLIRRKKPWALMALTLFLLGISFNYLFAWNRWRATLAERFEAEAREVDSLKKTSDDFVSQDTTLKGQFDEAKKLGEAVVGGADARFLVLELVKAVQTALPEPAVQDLKEDIKIPYEERPELYIESVDSEFFQDLSEYTTDEVKGRYGALLKDLQALSEGRAAADGRLPSEIESDAESSEEGSEASGETTSETAEAPAESTAADAEAAPAEGEATAEEGGEIDTSAVDTVNFARPGWVVQIKGFHFYSSKANPVDRGKGHLLLTLLKQLDSGTVELPPAPGMAPIPFTMKELGIYYPIEVSSQPEMGIMVPDLNYDPAKAAATPVAAPRRGEGGSTGEGGDTGGVPKVSKQAYEFTVQFVWLETRASERMEARRNKESKPSEQPAAEQPSDQVVGN